MKKFFACVLSFFFVLKNPQFRYSSLNFVTLSWGHEQTSINWQNFAQVRL